MKRIVSPAGHSHGSLRNPVPNFTGPEPNKPLNPLGALDIPRLLRRPSVSYGEFPAVAGIYL